ncbi:ABC transporter ATP-binding protein [Devosia sp. 63-57]|uniref:ABC transporter ATP-binding protein n=1 Tax=Devosia sp. 63-57 TaxID=1895751 RepID=UPI00086ACCB2|nr:ABC transporter ATP-binding protein [Devosia sp. 63-57]ODT47932.1 MAG: ABC transporter ATP-binding protein [Pelagibacterium sp. SCN 63-126]ODU87900.1 MAG: ABC transporter ATP-binding protein [Pelagibacterium sp. SCN 63-17]OJX42358.1 MAG: ABC transporter ATP-binding protein [Devosia sp. 63-57]
MTDLPGRRPPPLSDDTPSLRERLKNLAHLGRLVAQIWRTSRPLTAASIGLRLIAALQPVAVLYAAKLIVDEVVRLTAITPPGPGILDWWNAGLLEPILLLLLLEFGLVLANDIIARATGLVDSILSELHSNQVSVELMAHAARLDLMHFESAEYQDRLERARRQAAGRNALLSQMFGQAQDILTVLTLAAGLFVYAPWLILLLPLSFIPSIWGETRFNTLAYMLSRWRTPERRELEYLRHIGASAETAKEVKLFGLGDYLISRFRRLAHDIFLENRRVAVLRASWGALFSAIASLAYYSAYAYIVWRTVTGAFTLGDLAFLSGSFLRLNGLFQKILLGFTQIAGQSMYLDDLFSFFEIEPTVLPPTNPKPFPTPIRQGIVFEGVGFRYPETENWVVRNLSFTLPAGETLALVGENGAGKTTIVKLLTRLYDPSEGRITVDGVDLRDMAPAEIHAHIGVIFQDFIRYSFSARDNIGVGRIAAREDQARIEGAAEQSLADGVIAKLPKGYDQQLGRLFKQGRDLSGGEWQKVAIARAYMRDAELIILDEPTAALDAKAEAEVFARFKGLAQGKSAVIISHRFSTVRMADRILVLDNGAILEAGTHEQLLAQYGRYAELFDLQAAGYR